MSLLCSCLQCCAIVITSCSGINISACSQQSLDNHVMSLPCGCMQCCLAITISSSSIDISTCSQQPLHNHVMPVGSRPVQHRHSILALRLHICLVLQQ